MQLATAVGNVGGCMMISTSRCLLCIACLPSVFRKLFLLSWLLVVACSVSLMAFQFGPRMRTRRRRGGILNSKCVATSSCEKLQVNISMLETQVLQEYSKPKSFLGREYSVV